MAYDLRPRGRVVDLACFYVGRFFGVVITRDSFLTILLLYQIGRWVRVGFADMWRAWRRAERRLAASLGFR